MEFNFTFKTGKKKSEEVIKESSVSMMNLYEQLPIDFIQNYLNTATVKQYNSNALQWMYDNVGEISSIIRYIAEKFAELPIKHVRISPDGTEKDLGETDLIKLLRKPNQFDNQKVFTENLVISLLVHGNVPINPLKATGFKQPTSLYLLPSVDVYAIPQYSDGMFGIPTPTVDFRMNPVTHYNFMVSGVPKRIEVDSMIYIKGNNINYEGGGWMYGQSKVYSASRSVETLSLIYDVINAVLSSPLGYVKRNSKSGESIDPYASFGDDDKKDAERRINSDKYGKNVYGTKSGKYSRFVTRADLGYVSMVEDLKKFVPVELKESEFETLCNIFYAIPTQIFNSKNASTYDNMTLADKAFYTKCLMPINSTIYGGISQGFGLTQRGELLKADFSKVECLQADKKLHAEVKQIEVETAIMLFNEGYTEASNQTMINAGLSEKKESKTKAEGTATAANPTA